MLSKNKIKSIQNLYQKKFREINNLFIVEGAKIVHEVLVQNKMRVKEVFALQHWVHENEKLLFNVEVNIIEEEDLKKISSQKAPNQVLAILHILPPILPESLNKQWVLLLDGIQDPGNMGTIIRLANWFGIETIICSNNTVDCYNSKVLQSSMGSFQHVNILYQNLQTFLESHSKRNIYAAVLNGKDIRQYEASEDGILIIGNEGNGISKELLPYCGKQISIVKKGNADSLNAAVATGIILSHLVE